MDEIEAIEVRCPQCGAVKNERCRGRRIHWAREVSAAVARNGLCNCHHGQEYHTTQVGCLIVGCGCPAAFSHLIAAPPPG